MHPWSVFGAKSRPGRCRGCPPLIAGLHHLEPPGPKMWFKCVLLDARGFKMALKLHLFSIGWYLDTQKMSSEREVGQKHEKIMKHRCENLMFSLAQNRVWRYTLRLFHTFGLFEKSGKVDAKMETKSRGFWSKMRPWAPNGRLILPFSTIFENSKNRWFFDVAFRRRKINKNWPVGVKGLPQGLRVSSGGTRFRRQCPQGGSRARIISR